MTSPYWKERIEREHQEKIEREKRIMVEDTNPMEDTFGDSDNIQEASK